MKNKVAVFGVFTSLALILSYVELLIPINFGICSVYFIALVEDC